MGDEDVLRQARQHFLDRLVEKSADLRPLIQRIQAFDEDLNERTDFMELITGDATDSTGMANTGIGVRSAGGQPRLRPDEFTGKSYFQSAKSYLERIKHAVSMDELLEALKKGGSPVGGKTPKKTLYISLVRSREFTPIPGQKNFIGLRSWYGNLKTDRKATDNKKHKK